MKSKWLQPVALALAFASLAFDSARAQEPITTIGDVQDRVVIAGGVDVVGLNGLDVVAIVPDRMLMDHITDSLTRFDLSGAASPWLATSWTNLDPLTWELKLRKNVRFQNGEPFNASVVKFYYDTMNDPNFQSPAKSNHTWVKNVEIVDDYTVRLTTREPFPTAPGQMALSQMVPPKYIKEVGFDGYRKKPIGSGAYKVAEYVRDDHVTLVANDDWWAGKPKIRTIIYRPIKEEAARVSALVAGEIDLAFDVPPELIPMVEGAKDKKIKRTLSSRSFMLWFNTIDASYPTNKRELREAINYAIDREALNKALFAGTGAPAAWLNRKTFGYDPDSKPVPYDPARAKQLLAQAGYPNGLDFVFDSPDARYSKDKELALAISGQLEKVGIRARVQTYEWSVFTKRMWSHQSSPMTLMAWVDSANDPDVQNDRILRSGGTWSQNADPKLDALMLQIKSEMNPDKRKALILEQQRYMRETWPVAYIAQMGTIAGVSAKMDWWQPSPNDAHRFYRLNRGT